MMSRPKAMTSKRATVMKKLYTHYQMNLPLVAECGEL